MALVSMRGVGIAFGGPKLLDGVDWQLEHGQRVGLVGRNGAGKTTLMRLLHGDVSPDEGEIVRSQGARIARLPQDVPAGRGGSVYDEVAAPPDDGDRAAHPPEAHVIEKILSRMGLDPDAAFASLSSGMKRRVLLARALASEPDVLLLDEPTNHLDIESIRWLEDYLMRYGGTLVFVTHDRTFLSRLATRIVEVDRGRLFDWSCDYPTFLERKEAALAAEERQNALFDKRLAHEEVWIRKGVEARRTRNEGRVRALKAMREARRERRDRVGSAKVQVQEADRSGALVLEAKGASLRYGERTVIADATTTVMRGDKIGIIGPNGSGKTTLIRLLLGQLPATSGTVRQGTNLEIAYFDQLRAALDEERTVQDNVGEGYENVVINGQPRHVLGYLQDFLFAPERARTLVRVLSGGERNRLLLAKLFTKPSNVLVLDEPTNDLDVETLELLENLLVDYQGTILLVSHDRTFLNNVATSVLSIDDAGRVRESPGGYDDWLRRTEAEASAAASAAKAASASAAAPASAPAKARKASYKERKELEELPARIDALEREQAQIHDAMGQPEFYQKEFAEISKVNARLEAIAGELAAAFERWEALEGLEG
ncbi:ATP-binding cassette domain-containing protein [Tundrisphaera sp. TA3]|uniref:ATP-binding cassette domain-containing protein n=1 Tax=Tundrisphaera sp. TA3 TaxID=3435775 RepID=UPI003EC10CE9